MVMPAYTPPPDTFIPLFDTVIQRHGYLAAMVFGLVWRYSQMRDGICRAAVNTLAARLVLSRSTVIRQLDLLVQAGLLKDHTPHLRNHPHTYRPHWEFESVCQEDPSSPSGSVPIEEAPIPPDNPEGLAQAQPGQPDSGLSPSSQMAVRLWEDICFTLYLEKHTAPCKKYTGLAQPIGWDGVTLTLQVQDEYARQWLSERLTSTTARILRGILCHPTAQIVFSG